MTVEARDIARKAPKTGPWIIGYALSVGAAFFATGSGLVTNPAIGALFWVPMLLCVVMILFTSWRRHQMLGTLSPASLGFRRRMVAAGVGTFLGFCAMGLVEQFAGRGSILLSLAAILPFAGFAAIIWCVHQYVADEGDEFLRDQATRQILIASFVTLVVAAIWGGLSYSGLVGGGWLSLVILIWFGGLGIGRLYNEMQL